MANRIVLVQSGRLEERVAAAAITPGHLVEFTSADTVQKHSTAVGVAENAFAVEDALQGKTINDAYAAGDLVQIDIAAAGAERLVWIAVSQTIVKGDKLTSAGNGNLKKVAAGTDYPIAVAAEAVTTDASTPQRIAARIL